MSRWKSEQPPDQFMAGDSVATQGVWLGERGKILNQGTQRGVEVLVQAIFREETHAKSECDYSEPNR